MGTPIARSAFVQLLDDTLRAVTEDQYDDLTKMKDMFFQNVPSEKAWEEYMDVSDLGDITEFNGKIEYLPMYSGYRKVIEPKEYAAGVQVQQKFIEDNRYDVLVNFAKKLMKSAVRTQEKHAVGAFNDAFSATYTYMTTNEEGVALCSNSHTTKVPGVSTTNGFDNLATSALSKTSVAANRLLMKGFKSSIGERIEIGENLSIVCPEALRDTATEITGTPAGLYTTDGTINTEHGRTGVIPYARLDDNSSTNWFLVDNDRMKESLLWIDRKPLVHNVSEDWDTYNMLQKIRGRWGYGVIDWRWVFGSNV